jgi:hypothetical protein
MQAYVFTGRNVNGKIKMKKHIWFSGVIAGMLLGMPSVNAPAAVSVYSTGSRVTFAINSEPSFVYLRTQGFSISIGSPYDIVYYGSQYYLNYNGRWYRSYSYRGPWVLVGYSRVPLRIRRHRFEDIRRYRDIEYRKTDSRNNRYQRNDDNRRRLLEQRYKAPESRNIQAQPNSAPEIRKVQPPQMRVPESRKIQAQPARTPEIRKVQQPQMKAPESRNIQPQPNRTPEIRKVQQPQMKAPASRKVQEQPNRIPEGMKAREQPARAPEVRKVKEQPKMAPEGRKAKDQQEKGEKGGGNRGKGEK